MARRMETDDRIVVMGEDVHHLNGGTNGATRGLTDAFPTGCSARRSARTPSPGSAAAWPSTGGSRPVVEFMYADFMWVAADQLFNQIGQGATHVRRRRRGAARAPEQGRDGHGLRLAALDGPGGHLCHLPRLAYRRARPRRSTTSV